MSPTASKSGATPGQVPSLPRILDAASVLLIDRQHGVARLLMGLRQPDNVFLPNKWVFPGGRLEQSDFEVTPATPLADADAAALLNGIAAPAPQSLAQALAVAAVRELFEETGHALALEAGMGAFPQGTACPALGPLGLRPHLAPLTLMARAITPPGRPRRYDTRFFVAERTAVIEGAGLGDGEFSKLGWFTIGEAQALDLPNITRRILADLETALAGTQGPLNAALTAPVPFYYQDGDAFRRDLIPRGLPRSQP